jgi:hypothetical protein
VLDQWLLQHLAAAPYTHVIGYSAELCGWFVICPVIVFAALMAADAVGWTPGRVPGGAPPPAHA